MTTSETPAYAADLDTQKTYDYDAFLSYSRADTPVAEGIQKGLHRIGRKMGRLHALRVFRDKTDLAASASLWDKIRAALDSSRYLVVVLSPNSAGSEWVNKEVDYWLTHRGPENLILVLADGTIIWDGSHGRFDPTGSTATLPALATENALADEPIYIDISENDPWNIDNPIFRDRITDIAAPIHGKPKYELASEDLREQQRFRRFRRLAFTGLAARLAVSIVASGMAVVKQREAEQQRATAVEQRNDALAGRLVAAAEAILKRVRGAPDDRALQELTVAARLSESASRGGLLTGLQATAATDKIIRTPKPPGEIVVTPDGSRIITGSWEEEFVRVWDATTGTQLSELAGTPQTGIAAVGLTPDGRHLLTIDTLADLALWDLHTGQVTRRFADKVSHADMSADGTRTVGTRTRKSPDDTRVPEVLVWDTATGSLINTLVRHDLPTDDDESPTSFKEVAVSPDGRRVVTADVDGVVRAWDVETGAPIGANIFFEDPINAKLPPPGGKPRLLSVYALAFSGNGDRFVVGFADGSIRIFDAATAEPAGETITGHDQPVYGLVFSPDGKQLASSGFDHTVRIWDIATSAPIGEPLTGHLEAVQNVAFTPDGQRIVSTSSDKTIRIWRADAERRLGSPVAVPTQSVAPGTDVVAMAPGAVLSLTGQIGQTALWNLDDDRVTALTLEGSDPPVDALAVTPDGRRAAVLAYKEILVWDLETGAMVSRIDDDTPSYQMAISPDGTRIATGSQKGLIELFDVEAGHLMDVKLDGLDRTISSLQFSPDSRQLVAGNTSGEVLAWDLETFQPVGDIWQGNLNPIGSLTYSPDGRLLAVAGARTIWILDAQTREPVGDPLTGHAEWISELAFSADGQLLASGTTGDLGEVRIWDLSSGQQISEPIQTDNAIGLLTFNSDDTALFAYLGATVWRWPGPAEWADLLCDKLSNNMSREQWDKWVSPDVDYVAGCPDLPIPE